MIVAQDLRWPNDIHIDQTTDSLYVADRSVIGVWPKNASTNYNVVDGILGKNSDKALLGFVWGIWVDENTKIVYTGGTWWNTIQRWHGCMGEVIVGMLFILINCHDL
jgi:hypothetical protein